MDSLKYMLVVDDMEINRAILGELFKDDYDLLYAENGDEALTLIQTYSGSTQVVLLDLRMPKTDGLQVLRQIKGDENTKDIPVIIITADGESQSEVAALNLGAEDYLTKPFEPSVVKRRVKNAVERIEKRQLERENQLLRLVKEQEENYLAIVKQTNMFVFGWELNGRAFMLGGEKENFTFTDHNYEKDFFGFDAQKNVHSEDLAALEKFEHKLAKQSATEELEVRLLKNDGSYRWCMMAVSSTFENGKIVKVLGTLSDIDEKVKSRNELIYRARYDLLTGAYNHQAFVDKAIEKIKSQPMSKFAIVHLDVKGFKLINELYGRTQGNRLLRQIVTTSQKYVGENGAVSRFSNDIFNILLQYQEKDDILAFIHNLKVGINSTQGKNGITFAFGICEIQDGETNVDLACDQASLALSAVKLQAIENYAFYDKALSDQEKLERRIETEMEGALANGEFKLYLQPKHLIATGDIVGAEVLVRWLHPIYGLISPGEFIPVFEKNGFIIKLDEYVWNETAKLLENWCKYENFAVPVSVNVSRVNAFNSNFYPTIEKLSKTYTFPLEMLEFELTESAFVSNVTSLYATLNDIKKLGFTFSMDDFGSGYSSLNMLKDAPISVVKLDNKFAGEEILKRRGKIIVRHVVEMATDLDLLVIAEGVESKMEAEALQQAGCNIAQGYYFSRPMPVENFEQLLHKETKTLK